MYKKQSLFGLIIIVGLVIGGTIANYLFFGLMTLAGFIVLVEGIPLLKWIFSKTSQLLDIIIFIATVVATAELGVTITGSLTVAGLGFTLVYAPYLKACRKKLKTK